MTEARVDDGELLALASLLETEGGTSLSVMVEQIRGFTDARLDRLAEVVGQDSPAQSILNLVLAERQAPRLQASFLAWSSGDTDLETGVLLVARTGYPRLDVDRVRAELDDLAVQIRPEIGTDDDDAALQRLIRFLQAEKGFHGNETDYYDPDNSFINRVLERRVGLPISLSVLYALVGRRLGLSIAGIALPNHFVAARVGPAGAVLFDPFHGGKLLTQDDVAAIVASAGQVLQPGHLRPATSRQIVQRMLANLVRTYDLHEELERAELVKQYLSVLT